MILRINLVDSSFASWDLSQLEGTILLDGQAIELNPSGDTTALLSTVPTNPTLRTTLITAHGNLNGKSVSISKESSIYLKLDIPFEHISQSANLQVVINLEGNRVFDRSYTIYGYDLGNNHTLGIVDNAPFVLAVFSPEIDYEFSGDYDTDYAGVVAALQIVTKSNFVSYRKPFTSEIHYFDATSSYGLRTWSLADVAGEVIKGLGNVQGFVCNDADSVIRLDIDNSYGVASSGGCGCGTPSLPAVSASAQDWSLHKYSGTSVWENSSYARQNIKNPLLKYQVWTMPNDLFTSCATCDESNCVVAGQGAYGFLNLLSSYLSTYRINDSNTHAFDKFKVEYRLLDHTGLIVDTYTYIENAVHRYNFVVNDSKRFDFTAPEYGDYVVYAKVTFIHNNFDQVYCERVNEIEACHWFGISQVSCSEYELHNRSFDEATVSVSLLNDEGFSVIETFFIAPLSSKTVSISGDGVYKFSAERNDKESSYIVPSYCNLKACLEGIIKGLLCAEASKIKDSDYYRMLSIMSVAQIYFLKVNKLHRLNYIYDVLADSQLEELQEIRELSERLSEYCTDCGTDSSFKSLNCGCP